MAKASKVTAAPAEVEAPAAPEQTAPVSLAKRVQARKAPPEPEPIEAVDADPFEGEPIAEPAARKTALEPGQENVSLLLCNQMTKKQNRELQADDDRPMTMSEMRQLMKGRRPLRPLVR